MPNLALGIERRHGLGTLDLSPRGVQHPDRLYVGLAKEGQPNNFVLFRPRKNALMLSIRLKPAAEIQSRLEESGLEALEYDKREGAYRIRLGPEDLKNRGDVLRQLIAMAYQDHPG